MANGKMLFIVMLAVDGCEDFCSTNKEGKELKNWVFFFCQKSWSIYCPFIPFMYFYSPNVKHFPSLNETCIVQNSKRMGLWHHEQ